MLYYDFKNYEEFKEIFAMVEHGNGVKSRRNKILLALYKDKQSLRRYIKYKDYKSCNDLYSHFDMKFDKTYYRDKQNGKVHAERYAKIRDLYSDISYSFDKVDRYFDLFNYENLPILKCRLLDLMGVYALRVSKETTHTLFLNNRVYQSDSFETDDLCGLCEDGTLNAIRYKNIEKGKMFKMKAGRMFNHLMGCNLIMRDMPYEIKRWLSEMFVNDWIAYAEQNIGNNSEYTLHVNDDFWRIYDKDECAGYDEDDDSFGSCMVDDEQYFFYKESVKAKAAFLTNEDNMVVARCILFTDVTDEEGNKWRLAERQYAANCDEDLKRKLVCALIKGGYIDGYKRTTASCHESTDFVDNEGNSLMDKVFSIECTLRPGDTLSYQDSFKYYNVEEGIAYNHGGEKYDICLDVTNESLDGVRCEHRDNEEYFECLTKYCKNTDSYEHVDDCIEIDDEWYYAGYERESPEKYGIVVCPKCFEIFYSEDGYYSDITGETYCCSDCRDDAELSFKEDNWYWSEYDNAYFENEEDVITVKKYNDWYHEYKETTISVELFNRIVELGEATEFCGEHFIDDLNFDGEPVHYGLVAQVA